MDGCMHGKIACISDRVIEIKNKKPEFDMFSSMKGHERASNV